MILNKRPSRWNEVLLYEERDTSTGMTPRREREVRHTIERLHYPASRPKHIGLTPKPSSKDPAGSQVIALAASDVA